MNCINNNSNSIMIRINNPIPEIVDPATADAANAEPATATVDIDTFLESIENNSDQKKKHRWTAKV